MSGYVWILFKSKIRRPVKFLNWPRVGVIIMFIIHNIQ